MQDHRTVFRRVILVTLFGIFSRVGEVVSDVEGETGYPDYIEETREAFDGRDRLSVRIRDIEKWSTDESSPVSRGNYLRVKWSRTERWTAGFLVERDPGEVRLADNWKWALSCRVGRGRIKTISLGYLRCELTRGLLFFTRSRVSKGSQVLAPSGRTGRGLGPDLSAAEGYALRGAGLEIEPISCLTITAVVSSSRLDAVRDGEGRVTAVRTVGYHLPSSSTDPDGLSLTTQIGHIALSTGKRGMVGVTFADLRYSEAIVPPFETETAFDFRGRRRSFSGFDWDLNIRNIKIFGESGWEHGRGAGIVAGIQGDAGATRWNVLFRDYDPDFSPPFGNPFQDGREFPCNEKGFYSGLEWKMTSDVRFALYIDSYRRPWREGRDPFPETEREIFLENRWRISRRTWFSLRFLERYGMKTETEGNLSVIRDLLTRKIRLQVDWEDRPMTFRGRYEQVVSGNPDVQGETGSILFFDTRYRYGKRVDLDLRVTLFNSGSPSATVYAYENDLPGIMNIAACSGDGMKWYLYGRLRIREAVTLGVKFNETRRTIVEDRGIPIVRTNRWLGIQLDYQD